MKNAYKFATLALVVSLAFSCGQSQRHDVAGTEEAAKEANEDKFQTHSAEGDASFVVEAVTANYGDIALAQLAENRSDNADVKDVAKSVAKEHNQLLKDLQKLAGAKAITVPSEKDASAGRAFEKLNEERSIKDFNKKWCSEMVDSHEKCIRAFEAQLEKTGDEDLKNLINQSLPHLREHLDKLKAAHERLKNA